MHVFQLQNASASLVKFSKETKQAFASFIFILVVVVVVGSSRIGGRGGVYDGTARSFVVGPGGGIGRGTFWIHSDADASGSKCQNWIDKK